MRKVAVPQILLLMLVAGVLLTGCDTLQARMELNKGNSYYKNEKFKDALIEFQHGLALDPSLKFAWRSVALSAMTLYRPGVDDAREPAVLQHRHRCLQEVPGRLPGGPEGAGVHDLDVHERRQVRRRPRLPPGRDQEEPGRPQVEQGGRHDLPADAADQGSVRLGHLPHPEGRRGAVLPRFGLLLGQVVPRSLRSRPSSAPTTSISV